MVTIHSHQWLKLNEAGLEASQSRLLRMEERELLQALRSAPVRVVDLFRRLRVTDGQAFQEVLGKAVSRGWVEVHDVSPSQVIAPESETEAPTLSSEDALGALLARYAQEQERTSEAAGVATPEWEKPKALPEPEPEQGLEFPSSPEAWVPPSESLNEKKALTAPVPEAYVELPPEGADALFAAMGIDPQRAANAMVLQADSEKPSKEPKPSKGGDSALLEALAASTSYQPPAVTVPEYGLPSSPSIGPTRDDGFFRLMDVGAGLGAISDSEAPTDSSSPVPPAKNEPSDEPTARTRHRLSARERMLEAARREEADRQAAKERAREAQERKASEQEAQRQRIAAQRAQEELARAPSFLSRAEKARRIRNGLPPNSD